MKIFRSATSLLAIAACAPAVLAAPGDTWSLSGDMQVISNPSPPIDPGAPGGGSGVWTYFGDNGAYTTSTTNVLADVNGEVPDAGSGWYRQGPNHIMLIKFSVDANPVPPTGTGNDKTNFKIGDVGGHATTGAEWKTDHAGTFRVDWLGYNARDQRTANPNEQGRQTILRLTGPAGDLDVKTLIGGAGFDGSANAYTNTAVVSLGAGGTLRLMQEGSDWAGLNLRIAEVVPEPAGLGSLVVGLLTTGCLGRRRRRLQRSKFG